MQVRNPPPHVGETPESRLPTPLALMHLAHDIASPGWPERRAHLIDFALAFLKADVMLHASGYVKRRLVRRLQQSDPSAAQIGRVDALLRRAVMSGTGLEAFRAFCRIAAHLVHQGHLPGLPDWLENQAEGAILTLRHGDLCRATMMPRIASLSDGDRERFESVRLAASCAWGIVYPDGKDLVHAGDRVDAPSQRIRRNALRMCVAIRKRWGGRPPVASAWHRRGIGVPSARKLTHRCGPSPHPLRTADRDTRAAGRDSRHHGRCAFRRRQPSRTCPPVQTRQGMRVHSTETPQASSRCARPPSAPRTAIAWAPGPCPWRQAGAAWPHSSP